MTDPLTTIGFSAAAAYVGKDVMAKLLGPTAEYLGEGLRDLVRKRADTVDKILASATQKLGPRIEEPGTVPPKILKSIISDGSFATENVEVEYFAGILAASRTRSGRDDRGVRALKTILNLSSYQIRTHYIAYSCIVDRYFKSTTNINDNKQASKMQILFSFESYFREMEILEKYIGKDVGDFVNDILSHSLHGLVDDGLVSKNVAWGSADHIKHKWVMKPGIVVAPTRSGLELFRLGLGATQTNTISVLLDPDIQSRIDKELIKRMNPEIPTES